MFRAWRDRRRRRRALKNGASQAIASMFRDGSHLYGARDTLRMLDAAEVYLRHADPFDAASDAVLDAVLNLANVGNARAADIYLAHVRRVSP